MINYFIVGSVSFFVGFLVALLIAFFIFKRKNDDATLYLMLKDFKNSIDEYKNQTMINTNEVNNAIKTASNLVSALTTNQNLKGQFGEDCLESILKVCYPNENINYFKQYRVVNAENKEIRPDFVVDLPNNKSILIDCKLNLDKYLEYTDNINTDFVATKKAEFIKDLNETINSLSNKKYETAQGISQPDFVLMYIPVESIVSLIYTDNDFISVIKNANEKNIIIVGNSSVLTVIRLVRLLWAADAQDRNIEKIVSIAQNIYNLVATHSVKLAQVKNLMMQGLEIFNKEYDKISSDKLFRITQELKDCGISSSSKREGKKLVNVSIHQDFLD